MEDAPLASRIAIRVRWPVALVGVASAAISAANLIGLVSDRATTYAAVVVAFGAAAMFLCAVLDMKLQRALSALNAERRGVARRRGWLSRATGVGLPVGDRMLAGVSIALLVVTFAAANFAHRLPAAGLGFAAFLLVVATQIPLMVRGYPTDRWAPPFS